MRVDNSDTTSLTQRLVGMLLLALWLFVYAAQLVLYTSITEIVLYSALGIVIALGFLRWAPAIRSLYVLLSVIVVASIILGLVPYKIRLHDWALFFFQSAKDEAVTYYVDPFLNVPGIVWDAIFPIAHFAVMCAVAKNLRPQNPSTVQP